MITRETIARWLAPKMAREADRYNRMFGQMITEIWWLTEFPDVCDTLQRLLDADRNHWRQMDEQHQGELPDGISEFREMLRARASSPEMTRLKSELARVLDANSRQASCIHQCASAIGPDTCRTVDGLPKAVKHLADQLRLARSGGTNKATVDAILQAVSEAMIEARVDYPAGREAGHMIEYDEDELRRQIIAVLPAQPANGAANG